MNYDYYAYLAELDPQDNEKKDASCLASGFIDECIVQSCQKEEKNKQGKKVDHKNDARKDYQNKIREISFEFPSEISSLFLKPDFSKIPAHWLSLEIPFTLQTPWYSKDDKPFHILDNPVHKDKVFGVPFMPASAWKGLLRWACRMQAGLFEHLEKDPNMDNWQDLDWIIHLFGNEKEEKKDFKRGTLVFYPTWFSKIGFEVINPHSRETRAGKGPIFYEVVPADTEGILSLLYAPTNIEEVKKYRKQALDNLVNAIEQLLTVYGFSAKRTAGWGIASIESQDIENIRDDLQKYYDKEL